MGDFLKFSYQDRPLYIYIYSIVAVASQLDSCGHHQTYIYCEHVNLPIAVDQTVEEVMQAFEE